MINNSEGVIIKKKSYIILIVFIILACLASCGFSMLAQPLSLVRALLMAMALTGCFCLINYSGFTGAKLILNCGAVLLATFAILQFIPAFNFSDIEFARKSTHPVVLMAPTLRVIGYFMTFLLATVIATVIFKTKKIGKEKDKKIAASLVYFFIGSTGGALFSAINNPEFIIFTAITGLVYSAFIYGSFFIVILVNDFPAKFRPAEELESEEA